jgi:cyanophycinase
LIIIGGGEDREGEKTILRDVVRRSRRGKVVVATVATRDPEGYFEMYDRAFGELGVAEVVNLEIRTRCDALDQARLQALEGAAVIFFTGGDQLRITSQIGDTPVEWKLRALYESGCIVAGTSAGASAVCETMLVRGSGRESHRIGDVEMAPGLGFLQDVVIDQHFAQRGRMGRLLGVVAENPRVLGIGIDEDTAIIVENEARFEVLGTGAVYVVDGGGVTQSNIADERTDSVLSIYDVRLHVLSSEDRFLLPTRRPEQVPVIPEALPTAEAAAVAGGE